ncbi:hypothetical protein F751_0091 [Auxenochlorella protothecoides]|uniref:Uncharacterized protein n=1 Tax=Auxenochlorella protothecoides TaxID=3075 RepID=A0A087S9S9_AUXPR|nr:hypothetical protein F751_0091 [Auxenochlorella protothecoides]KFM22483.1 hypothetical protein F751_0091 [Auxenochlorella protothecoides]
MRRNPPSMQTAVAQHLAEEGAQDVDHFLPDQLHALRLGLWGRERGCVGEGPRAPSQAKIVRDGEGVLNTRSTTPPRNLQPSWPRDHHHRRTSPT